MSSKKEEFGCEIFLKIVQTKESYEELKVCIGNGKETIFACTDEGKMISAMQSTTVNYIYHYEQCKRVKPALVLMLLTSMFNVNFSDSVSCARICFVLFASY